MKALRNILLVKLLFLINLSVSHSSDCNPHLTKKNLSYEASIKLLREKGFITGIKGNRSFNTTALMGMKASEILSIYESIKREKDQAAKFWLLLTGSTLSDNKQSSCFIGSVMTEKSFAILTLKNLSTLIKRMPEKKNLVLAMNNITSVVDGETILGYLQKEQAVVYSSSLQGHSVGNINALHNRKYVQHLPNALMKIMAKKLKEDDVVSRATIYQVRHMGYE